MHFLCYGLLWPLYDFLLWLCCGIACKYCPLGRSIVHRMSSTSNICNCNCFHQCQQYITVNAIFNDRSLTMCRSFNLHIGVRVGAICNANFKQLMDYTMQSTYTSVKNKVICYCLYNYRMFRSVMLSTWQARHSFCYITLQTGMLVLL